jgi:UDP-N-acetyl-D-galactosamine dehydrogenase
MYNSIINKQKKISVIGLGYVGLPIALEFAKHVKVVGFDIKPERVEMMKNRIDPSNELESEAFDGCDIVFTANPEDLKDCHFHIVAVPTPIDEHNLPDLTPVIKASETVLFRRLNFRVQHNCTYKVSVWLFSFMFSTKN